MQKKNIKYHLRCSFSIRCLTASCCCDLTLTVRHCTVRGHRIGWVVYQACFLRFSSRVGAALFSLVNFRPILVPTLGYSRKCWAETNANRALYKKIITRCLKCRSDTQSLMILSPCCRGMSYDVASDWLRAVLGKAHPIRVRNYLIGEDHGDSKLLRHPSKLSQEPETVHETKWKSAICMRAALIQAKGWTCQLS